ncbi:peptidylprolyl isomerase [bacterium]|nr:peptidylprolyl isomerase [bacterium]
MRRLAAFLACLAGPALAVGLEIEVVGETVSGTVQIDLLEDVAPLHAAQITALAERGAYDGVVFHRVIEGFMAQTGDVRFGKNPEDMSRAGMGGSDLGNIPAEFSDVPFDRGVVGMARSQNPNSANSQFFIMFEPGYFLNGQYTVVGRVTAGMDVVDALKRGHPQSGAITGQPDVMQRVTAVE